MEELTYDECTAWRKRHRVPFGYPKERREASTISFSLPERPRDQIVLSDTIASRLGEEALVQFIEWPMFSRWEMRVFHAWRERQGCPSRLVDAPGFRFPNGTDNETARALLFFLLAYQWEARIFTASGNFFGAIQPYAAEFFIKRGSQPEVWRETFAITGLLSAAG